MEIPDELLAKAHVVAKKIAIALQEETGCAGVNILQNNGKIAGQSVFHLHIHVIPRYENDAAKIGWQPGEVDSEFLNGLAKRIGEKLK